MSHLGRYAKYLVPSSVGEKRLEVLESFSTLGYWKYVLVEWNQAVVGIGLFSTALIALGGVNLLRFFWAFPALVLGFVFYFSIVSAIRCGWMLLVRRRLIYTTDRQLYLTNCLTFQKLSVNTCRLASMAGDDFDRRERLSMGLHREQCYYVLEFRKEWLRLKFIEQRPFVLGKVGELEFPVLAFLHDCELLAELVDWRSPNEMVMTA